MNWLRVLSLLLIYTGLSVFWAEIALAAGEPIKRQWSISPLLGTHDPSLKSINDGVFLSPFAGTSGLLTATGASTSNLLVFPNTLPKLSPGAYSGFEFEWTDNTSSSWLVGLGSWASSSSSVTSGDIPFQRRMTDTIYQRRADISYNEVFIGMRYNILHSPQRYRIYGRFTLNTLFDIDYSENQLLSFKIADGQRVTRSILLEGQATAALLSQFGLGAEMFVGERFSLSVEAGYTVSARDFFMKRTIAPNTDFDDGDGYGIFNVNLEPDDNGQLQYLAQDGETYLPMPLKFNGWKLLFRVSMFY